jgi:hypothetical protein
MLQGRPDEDAGGETRLCNEAVQPGELPVYSIV